MKCTARSHEHTYPINRLEPEQMEQSTLFKEPLKHFIHSKAEENLSDKRTQHTV